MRVVLDLSAFRNHPGQPRHPRSRLGGQLPARRRPLGGRLCRHRPVSPGPKWRVGGIPCLRRQSGQHGQRGPLQERHGHRRDLHRRGTAAAGGRRSAAKRRPTADLTDFYTRTLGYLASIDSNHLRSTVGPIHLDWQHLYGGGRVGHRRGRRDLRPPANTLPALHTYPPQYAGDGSPIDYQTPDMAPVAAANAKPWFTEEFGWTQSVGDATRADYYGWLYDEQATYGSSGALFWNLGLEAGRRQPRREPVDAAHLGGRPDALTRGGARTGRMAG